MPANEAQHLPESEEPSGQSISRRERTRASKRVTEARALAQRTKLDAQAEARQEPAPKVGAHQRRGGKQTQRGLQPDPHAAFSYVIPSVTASTKRDCHRSCREMRKAIPHKRITKAHIASSCPHLLLTCS